MRARTDLRWWGYLIGFCVVAGLGWSNPSPGLDGKEPEWWEADGAGTFPTTVGSGFANFALDDVGVVQAGESIELPFSLESTFATPMVAFSVDFPPEVLQFSGAQLAPQLFRGPPMQETFFETHFDNEAGWVQVVVVTDFDGREVFSIPPGIASRLVTLDFEVDRDAPAGVYDVPFVRDETADFEGELMADGMPIYNAIRAAGLAFDWTTLFDAADVPELDDGRVVVDIIGDIGVFRVGDANDDGDVDIGDAMSMLIHLFGGGAPLPCPRSADTTQDARVDIADPVFLLRYLFSDSFEPVVGLEILGNDCSL